MAAKQHGRGKKSGTTSGKISKAPAKPAKAKKIGTYFGDKVFVPLIVGVLIKIACAALGLQLLSVAAARRQGPSQVATARTRARNLARELRNLAKEIELTLSTLERFSKVANGGDWSESAGTKSRIRMLGTSGTLTEPSLADYRAQIDALEMYGLAAPQSEMPDRTRSASSRLR